ncbi:MAG TPA: glycosyltransferase [Candidatus Limnocylindrales bacterium]|nr:glycosyltransferase [Candidatus Limnocylindrales bacterium]
MSDRPPVLVETAAQQRAEARAARDWTTADRLRGQIEAAGWKVIDVGMHFRLEPASPPDVEVGGEIRYGRSDAVPSRLDEPATGLASVVLVASSDPPETQRCLDALVRFAPDGTDVVVVADGLPDRALDGLRGDALAARAGPIPAQLVRTSAVLGQAAALNAGIRAAPAGIVIAIDPSITATGDIVTPLVRALDEPDVAIAGPFGLTSRDLRTFDEAIAEGGGSRTVAAVQGYLMAFRRAEAVAHGPLDEGFRYYRNLDIWWSLVLRDAGEGAPPRRAVAVPGVPVARGEPRAWATTPAAERDRLSKRNFYRVLDRFRTRVDLAVD